MVYQVKDSADLQTKLSEAESKLVVIDFFATWCGPCKMIAPVLEDFSKEFPNVVFLKVDVDECEDVAAEYEITSMPTFVFIKNKNKVDFFAGAHAEKIKATIQKNAS